MYTVATSHKIRLVFIIPVILKSLSEIAYLHIFGVVWHGLHYIFSEKKKKTEDACIILTKQWVYFFGRFVNHPA